MNMPSLLIAICGFVGIALLLYFLIYKRSSKTRQEDAIARDENFFFRKHHFISTVLPVDEIYNKMDKYPLTSNHIKYSLESGVKIEFNHFPAQHGMIAELQYVGKDESGEKNEYIFSIVQHTQKKDGRPEGWYQANVSLTVLERAFQELDPEYSCKEEDVIVVLDTRGINNERKNLMSKIMGTGKQD